MIGSSYLVINNWIKGKLYCTNNDTMKEPNNSQYTKQKDLRIESITLKVYANC